MNDRLQDTQHKTPKIIRITYTQTTTPSQDVQDMVAQADTGARNPLGIPGRILWLVPFPTVVRITSAIYFQYFRSERH
jgi:hypothetical protein